MSQGKADATVFLALLKANQLPKPEQEYRFHPVRKWRFDYAFPDKKLALEVEGGVWIQGRHTRGSGFVRDVQKYNAASCLGWRLLRVTPRNLATLDTIAMVKQALEAA